MSNPYIQEKDYGPEEGRAGADKPNRHAELPDDLHEASLGELIEAWELDLSEADRRDVYTELEQRGYNVSRSRLPPASADPHQVRLSTPLEHAQRQMDRAALAAYLSAAIPVVQFLVAVLNGERPTGPGMDSAAHFAPALLVAGLGFGLSRGSRIAGLLLGALWVADRTATYLETGQSWSLPLAAAFLYLFLRGTWAAFRAHWLRKRSVRDGDA